MKKLLCLIVLMLVLTMSFNCFAIDVKMTDVNYETELGKSIDKLVKAGVISGIPQEDGTLKYEANKEVTRAEFCKMVNVTFNYEKMQDNIFTDVYPEKWYYVHVLKAISEGYISGYGDGRFGGEDYITREQVCTILSRILNKPSDKKIEIKDNVSGWAFPYVENIIALGYMNLEEGNTFRATQNMTRGELAQTLDKFVVEKEKPSEQKPSADDTSSEEIKPSGSNSGSSGSGSSDSSSSGNGSNNNTSNTPDPEPETEYTITYEINSIGSLPESAKTAYTASVLPYTLPVLSNTSSYIFEGWFTDSSFEGQAVKKITSGTEQNLTFYAKWRPRYTEEELRISQQIYDSLEFALDDIAEKEELEVFEFDEKGQTIFDFLKTCSAEVYALENTGFVVSNAYVRSTYSNEIAQITAILDGMTTEERELFEFEVNKLNVVVLKDLVSLFDVNINYGK